MHAVTMLTIILKQFFLLIQQNHSQWDETATPSGDHTVYRCKCKRVSPLSQKGLHCNVCEWSTDKQCSLGKQALLGAYKFSVDLQAQTAG